MTEKMSFMTLYLTILLGGLLADQAVLPLNIHRGSTSASMSHADIATKTQGDRHTDSVIAEFQPAGWNGQCQKPVPTVRDKRSCRNVAICSESEMEDSTTARDARIPGLSQKDCLDYEKSQIGKKLT